MSNVIKATAVGGGAAFGNGLAYFGLWWAGYKYNLSFEDPELALAMGGAVIASVLIYLTRFFSVLGRGIVYMFNRVFPEKKE
jgi:hypothetical protein